MITNKKSAEMHKIFLARAKKEKGGCIKCGRKNISDTFYQKKSKQYMCLCLLNVSPMAGTPMNKSHIPLDTWFGIIKDVTTSDTGIDIKTVEEKYRLSNTSAWNIMYKIKDWINLVEEKSGCQNPSKFVKVVKKGCREIYVLKYNMEIPPKQMEKRMLDILPPLFEHLREAA